MNTTTTYLSKRGMKELKRTVQQLERQLAKVNQELRDVDKTDNRDNRLARLEKLSLIESLESDVAEKRTQLAHSAPLPRRRDALKVALGSVVDLMDQQGRLIRYTIVDTIEANPSDGRISILSPLGQNLIGKTVSDTIEWTAGRLQTRSMKLVRVM